VAEREGKEAVEGLPPRRALSRRTLFTGAAAVGAGLLGLESLSLDGRFDHRRALETSGGERFRASLAGAGDRTGVIHVGHSTHLLCVKGKRLLTDPWFYDPAFGSVEHSPAPAVAPDGLGTLDAILVSHDHPDHADLRALDRMSDKSRTEVLVATEELGRQIRGLGFSGVHVLRVGEKFSLGELEIFGVPAVHDVVEIGFVVDDIYFAGDTRLTEALPAIKEQHRPHLALLPVDGTRIRTGGKWVMTPEDAVSAAEILGVSRVIPSHAEARFFDPLVKHLLTTTVSEPGRKFSELVARTLPKVTCTLPQPGEWVPVKPA
jgi:L-ascorbate metabolism protein UlaG (beta-lactamase superfamily)